MVEAVALKPSQTIILNAVNNLNPYTTKPFSNQKLAICIFTAIANSNNIYLQLCSLNHRFYFTARKW